MNSKEKPVLIEEMKPLTGHRQSSRRPWLQSPIVVIAVIMAVIYWLCKPQWNSECDGLTPGYYCEPDIWRSWGQYSPFFVVPSKISSGPPPRCTVTFAQGLYRHGARDPTAGKSAAYAQLISKIKSAAHHFKGHYKFLKHYEYTLGADQLTDFGRMQLVFAGGDFNARYRALSRNNTIFIRAAGQQRVIESAEKWAEGVHMSRLVDKHADPDNYPYKILIISEDSGSNNTLSHDLCPAFEAGLGYRAQQEWAHIFVPPILERLNHDLPGVDLTLGEVVELMDLCPFESVSRTGSVLSDFCRLFSADEWTQYDYYQSLGKYYGFSHGNPFAATQGAGFVNELIARLTGKSVNDHTSVNQTLDSNPETFPLGGDNVLYADFSHDNDISAIISALGLYNSTAPLSKRSVDNATHTKGYSAAWTVPFASRAYVEKLRCDDDDDEYVRVIINDRVMPLETCGGDDDGKCTLDAFVKSLWVARHGGLWEQC